MGKNALTTEKKAEIAVLLSLAALEAVYYYRPRKKSLADRLWDLI